MIIELNLKQAKKAIRKALSKGLVPTLQGPPGLGKSDMIRDIASSAKLKLIDLRLAQCEPNDLLGYPAVVDGKSTYMPMDTFPLEGEDVPEGFKGWLLFLDEIRNAPVAVQMAAYKLILDREVGNHKLHPKVFIVAASNGEEDNCFVTPMSDALKSRMIHLRLRVDPEEWTLWALKNDIDTRIISFIGFQPDQLASHELSKDSEESYGCYRTWYFTSELIKGVSTPELINDEVEQALVQGSIGSSTTTQFLSYLEFFADLPHYKEVLSKPETAKIPDHYEIGLVWATIGMLSTNFEIKDIDPVLTYINRLPSEFQVVFIKDIAIRHKEVLGLKQMQPWIATLVDTSWS